MLCSSQFADDNDTIAIYNFTYYIEIKLQVQSEAVLGIIELRVDITASQCKILFKLKVIPLKRLVIFSCDNSYDEIKLLLLFIHIQINSK